MQFFEVRVFQTKEPPQPGLQVLDPSTMVFNNEQVPVVDTVNMYDKQLSNANVNLVREFVINYFRELPSKRKSDCYCFADVGLSKLTGGVGVSSAPIETLLLIRPSK